MNPLAEGKGNWKRTGVNQVTMALPLNENDPTLGNPELVKIYLNQIMFMYPRITQADINYETTESFGVVLSIVLHGYINKPF